MITKNHQQNSFTCSFVMIRYKKLMCCEIIIALCMFIFLSLFSNYFLKHTVYYNILWKEALESSPGTPLQDQYKSPSYPEVLPAPVNYEIHMDQHL